METEVLRSAECDCKVEGGTFYVCEKHISEDVVDGEPQVRITVLPPFQKNVTVRRLVTTRR